MALARYYRKNALALSQVLQGGSLAEFERLLLSHVVEVAFDRSVEKTEGKAMLDMTIRLLCRLYPKVQFRALGSVESSVRQECVQRASAINRIIEVAEGLPTAIVVIGATPYVDAPAGVPVFYIGSRSWQVLLSVHGPVGCGDSALPFAAGVAACLGAANVFRHVFKQWLPKATLDTEVQFTLLPEGAAEDVQTTDLGNITLAGIGAVGNGAIWALAQLSGINGRLRLVDPQLLEDTNLQRYVLCEEQDEGILKVVIAQKQFAGSLLVADPYEHCWRSYVSSISHWRDEVVLTALDSARDRMEVQSSLPRVIFNGFTERGLLGVSRHRDFVGAPCLTCLYLPAGKQKNYSERVAEELGIASHERRVRELLHYRKGVDKALLELIAQAKGIAYELLEPFIGTPISEFYNRFVCGGMMLQWQTTEGKGTVEAPLAFQSAWAGILLAAEVYLWKAGLNGNTPQVTHFFPLRALQTTLNPYHHTIEKDASGRCICNDSHFSAAYQKKWTSI